MGRFTIRRTDQDKVPALENYADGTVFQMNEWMNFVAESQDVEPVYATVNDGDRVVGRFSGFILRKYGMRILGSPFPGWTTSYMGFNLDEGISRADALVALEEFAFGDLKCIHVEIMDRRLTEEDFQEAGYGLSMNPGYEVDLSQSEDDLLAGMTSNCRWSIRRAARDGIEISTTTDISFVDEYYDQLEEVFGKQNLVPTYSRNRVRQLVEHLLPTGQLLLLRGTNKDGVCVATGLFPAFNDTSYFWGGASWREYQKHQPNEGLQWFAWKYWKERGITRHDMGGAGDYKRKYGGADISIPWGRKSKYPILETARNLGRDVFALKQRVMGRLKR